MPSLTFRAVFCLMLALAAHIPDARADTVGVRSAELRVESFRIARSSGNPDFDLSVEQQLQRLVDGQAVIPPPPEDVASSYHGRDVSVRFNGRDAR